VAFREEELILAQTEVQDARDRLIKATNLFPEELVWDVQIIPDDQPLVTPPGEYREEEQVSVAFRNRPELRQLLKHQEAAKLGSRFAKNQLLPTLELSASVGLIGLDDDFGSSFFPPPPDKGIDPAIDDLFSGENFQWMVGLKFEFPWGNRSARGRYTAANLQVSQLDASIRNLRQVIIQDTRNALRGVETNWNRVVLSRETTRFRQESLAAEKKKFDVGVSTTHDLLEFEEELAAARASEQRAIIDYTISLTNLMRATATLLEARSVRITADL
jgi:outer membrane protein TolC